jgi:hypothetical protein
MPFKPNDFANHPNYTEVKDPAFVQANAIPNAIRYTNYHGQPATIAGGRLYVHRQAAVTRGDQSVRSWDRNYKQHYGQDIRQAGEDHDEAGRYSR